MTVAPIEFIKILQDAGVDCPRVLNAVGSVDRTVFLEKALQPFAWQETTLPIGNGQTISLPSIVGRMTQALDIKSNHTVLEIGTGCGYQTAVLSKLAKSVYTLERHPTLAQQAKQRFQELSIKNIISSVDDGQRCLQSSSTFDSIIMTCSALDIPMGFLKLLKNNGKMVLPTGEQGEDQELLCITKTVDGMDVQEMGSVRFVPMLEGIGQ